MLDSTEWAAKYVYLHQLNDFASREELTDEEKITLKWMTKKVEQLREKENGS